MATLKIANISCGQCARTVRDVIVGLDPAARVAVDIRKRTVEVESTADMAIIGARLAASGYPPR